ncbi:hypothetical protein L1042_20745, partial [Escherichia coli]|nr:hypothetical protein [Escherichia coli]
DRNRSHWSTSKTPSYTKSVSWQHHPMIAAFFLLTPLIILILRKLFMREMFEFWVYVFSLGICLVCGWWLFWGRFIFCY